MKNKLLLFALLSFLAISSALAQFKPESKTAFEAQCQYALSLLPVQSDEDVPDFVLFADHLPYWTDTITTQPESYVMDAEGNVEISN